MKASIYRTNIAENQLLELTETVEIPYNPIDTIERMEDKAIDVEKPLINVHPDLTYQTILGFGGAFTESSAELYSKLSEEEKEVFLDAYFTRDKGIGYNFGRTHINSCDFSMEDFFYIEEGDDELKTFDISRDLEKRIPMLRDAAARTDLTLFASPWTPPKFMKTVDAVQGGKLKKEYYAIWARYMHRFVEEYAKAGVKVAALTMQNEPRHIQTWESCNYTMAEEAEFLGYLGRELEGTDIDIWCYDHCRERNYERTKACMEGGNGKYLKGVANHFYSGDHFGELRAVRERYPELVQIMSEGCCGVKDHSPLGKEFHEVAELYAHDITGCMNNGLNAYVDWNLTLDEDGEPRHNCPREIGDASCTAPIICDSRTGKVVKTVLYYYIGQFSKFVQRGAKNILTSAYTNAIDVIGFVNPDGTVPVVVTNRTDKDESFMIRMEDHVLKVTVAAHSIATLVIEA